MNYCIYLRKSRADLEDERNGVDTLDRHQKMLIDTAKRLHLPISQIYKEVVSGDSISARPVMINLLKEIKESKWDGVLVVEIERLARGDTIDQGQVARAFKFSGTKIITPMKTYDPNSEMDEEFFEFALFMSRREYKTIKRRLVAGMNQAALEGKFVKSIAPYGYDRIKLKSQKGFSLKPNDNSPAIVRVYEMFAEGYGYREICKKLDLLGYKPAKSTTWSEASIKSILVNPAYTGLIRNGYRANKNTLVNGEITKTRPRAKIDELILHEGLHQPIIDRELWNNVQQTLKNRKNPPLKNHDVLKNPLVNLVYCSFCGGTMTRKPDTNVEPFLYCRNSNCTSNTSTYVSTVEELIISAINEYIERLTKSLKSNKKATSKTIDFNKDIDRINNNIQNIKTQISKLHDFLEQGIYDTETFIERNTILKQKINDYEFELKEIQEKSHITKEIITTDDFLKQLKNVSENYYISNTAEQKNLLLKSVIEKIIYTKTKRGTTTDLIKDLNLEITFKLPQFK